LDNIRNQTQVLKDLGGEVSQDVKEVQTDESRDSDSSGSLSLVPGYGDDSDHDEEETEEVENGISKKDQKRKNCKSKSSSPAKKLKNIELTSSKTRGIDIVEIPDDTKPAENESQASAGS
jgi:hypothetical protein